MVFEYSSGVRKIADELLYRERQLPFDPKGFANGVQSRRSKSFATNDAYSTTRRLSVATLRDFA